MKETIHQLGKGLIEIIERDSHGKWKLTPNMELSTPQTIFVEGGFERDWYEYNGRYIHEITIPESCSEIRFLNVEIEPHDLSLIGKLTPENIVINPRSINGTFIETKTLFEGVGKGKLVLRPRLVITSDGRLFHNTQLPKASSNPFITTYMQSFFGLD